MKCKKPSQQELILVLLQNILEAEFLEHTHWKGSYFQHLLTIRKQVGKVRSFNWKNKEEQLFLPQSAHDYVLLSAVGKDHLQCCLKISHLVECISSIYAPEVRAL